MLRIPEKLLPIITKINDYRYFLIEGGRGGGKSQAVGRLILYLAEKKPLRIVCGRETQVSISESVYSILADLINKYNLYFEVQTSKIVHRITKTPINFRGFREQGAFNIQGMEGIDVLWIDESQAITKDTLDVLIPTIRKENAKIFFTMNRFVHNDPVFSTFIGRKDCLHIHINFNENPFCTNALKVEAEECKLRNEQDYKHIWLGEPLQAGDNLLLNFNTVDASPKLSFYEEGTQRRILAVDVARFGSNETVFTIIQSQNIKQWNQIYQHAWKGKSLTEVAGKILELKREFLPEITAVDDDGLGGGVVDILGEQKSLVEKFKGNGVSDNEYYYNQRTVGYYRLKDFFDKGDIKIINDHLLQEQLLSIMYKYRSNGQKIIVSKDDMMRLFSLPSPDRADALMMALYYTDRIFNERIRSNLPREAILI